MMQLRYGLRQDPDGSWTVFDVFTAAASGCMGAAAEYLDQGYAEDLAALLNSEDLKRRLSQGRVV
ncbi:MAG: hypothetical protein E5Y12_04720 [Mesorhizobium sp.]|nr:MAG: hypothetical protein E5Y12_04720 [Mesorhizobium sp.]